jgi:3-oxoacyl-(acyl-carrier-protein) synthase
MGQIRVGITAWGSISALGADPDTIWSAYQHPVTKIRALDHLGEWGCALDEEQEVELMNIRNSDRRFRDLDRTVLLALAAADQACRRAGWREDLQAGIDIGSSRGATGLWEKHHRAFLASDQQFVHPLTSPTTTLGNISSWVAHRLGTKGPAISHSITCSSALHALMNGLAWLEAGRLRRFLVGGSEAPLTPFTIAQMKALRIYAPLEGQDRSLYPCRALDPALDSNTMVLGEGAACFCLESEPDAPLAWISGVGYGVEQMQTATGISDDGMNLQLSMQMALRESRLERVDVIVCHSPGTRKGDEAERRAIQTVFGENIPLLTTNKWKIGHTLGASGGFSLEMAVLMLLRRQFVPAPYLDKQSVAPHDKIKTVMVNALGFGGNASSVILTAPGNG